MLIMDYVDKDKLTKELLEHKLIELLYRYNYSYEDIDYIIDQDFENISDCNDTDFEIHNQLFLSILKTWKYYKGGLL
jgi:hypothetical protein